MLNQYIIPGFLVPPAFNVEIEAYLKKQDINRIFFERQNLIAASLALLSFCTHILMDQAAPMDPDLRFNSIETNSESAMLQTHLFFEILQSRKVFVIRAVVNTKVKELLQSREPDEFLFGPNLAEEIKKIKALEKVCCDLGQEGGTKGFFTKSFLEARALHPYRNDLPWSA